MSKTLEKSELGYQIQLMNESYVRLQIFKNHPFDMSFFIDLTLKDLDNIIKDLSHEERRLKNIKGLI